MKGALLISIIFLSVTLGIAQSEVLKEAPMYVPGTESAWKAMKNTKVNTDSLRKAITYLDSLVLKDQNFAEAYFRRGVIKFELSMLKDALKDFDIAIELDSNHSEAYFYRARTHTFFPTMKALSDFNRAIELNPMFADAYWFRGQRKNSGESQIPQTAGRDDLLKAQYLWGLQRK